MPEQLPGSAAKHAAAQFLDHLIERLDEIEGTKLRIPEYDTAIWLHTPEQIARWLRNEFCEVVNAK